MSLLLGKTLTLCQSTFCLATRCNKTWFLCAGEIVTGLSALPTAVGFQLCILVLA